MSLKKQLARYKQHLKRPGEDKGSRPQQNVTENGLPKGIIESADQLGADIKRYDGQTILFKETIVDLNEVYNGKPLHTIYPTIDEWQKFGGDHPLSAKGLAAKDLLFFDTETTGLAAGAGHMIFLLGTGTILDHHLRIRQYFLPGPGHEAAFYHYFLDDIHQLENLVTFNGKSFDWPRVRTRHQFVKHQVPHLPAFGHFDLLHASRRLWKDQLSSVKLQTIEQSVLSMDRVGDVPGHMAPFLYFQFLKRPNVALIEGILQHNVDDIKTLVALYSHLSNLVIDPGRATTIERYQIGRWHAYLGNVEAAIACLQDNKLLQSHYKADAQKLLARMYKKAGDYHRSFDGYMQLIHNCCGDPEVYIEAAKLAEHQFNDYHLAFKLTRQARECCDSQDHPSQKIMADLSRRSERVRKKGGL